MSLLKTQILSSTSVRLAVALVSLAALGACGGSGGGGGTPAETTTMLTSAAGFDGDHSTPPNGPLAVPTTTKSFPTMRAGRNGDTKTRAFVSFDLPQDLAGKEIVSAMLRLFEVPGDGNPYANNGSVLAFLVDIGNTFSGATDPTATLLPLGAISTEASIGWKQLDVAPALRADLEAGRVRSQFRLTSTAELDSSPSGHAEFATAESSPDLAQAPQLLITVR